MRLTFLPAGVTVDVVQPASVLEIALAHGIDLEHACGGNCACTTCHIVIRAGEDNLSLMDEAEEERLFGAADLTLHSRLACQCVVRGDATVEIPAWNRNYG